MYEKVFSEVVKVKIYIYPYVNFEVSAFLKIHALALVCYPAPYDGIEAVVLYKYI